MPTNATFTITRDQVVTGALQLLGAIAKGEAADSTDIADCMVFLQAMLKLWDVNGKKAYLYKTISFPCVAAQAQYTIGVGGNVVEDRPIAIVMAYTLGANNDKQPLNPNTKQQFEMLTPKNQPGPANNYFYDAQLVLGVFNPWPVPSDTTRSFAIVVQRPINDIVNSGAATFDIPQEGYLALIFGLAELVADIYGAESKVIQRVVQNAAKYLEAFSDFAEEDGSVFFQVNIQGGLGYGRN